MHTDRTERDIRFQLPVNHTGSPQDDQRERGRVAGQGRGAGGGGREAGGWRGQGVIDFFMRQLEVVFASSPRPERVCRQ